MSQPTGGRGPGRSEDGGGASRAYYRRLKSPQDYFAVVAATAIMASSLIVGRAGYEVTWARFTSTKDVGGNILTTKPDWTPPTTSTSVIVNSLGNVDLLRQGDTYRVCANATDSGNPPSGIASLDADLALSGSVISSGQNAAPLSAGSYSCSGWSYNYQSTRLTADGTLPEGTKTYAITGIDNAGNSATTTWTVTVDNTPAAATGFATINHPGGVAGKIEVGDSMVFSYSEALDTHSIVNGWNGGSTPITVTVNNNVRSYNNDDTVTFSVNLGIVGLGNGQYTTASSSVFGASMLWDSSTNVITVTLSSLVVDRIGTATKPSAATYYPSNQISDLAGNAINTLATPSETYLHF